MTFDRADNRPKDLGESELRIIAPPPPYFQTHKVSLMLKSALIILIKL